MARPRSFNFAPMTKAKVGRVAKDFEPYVKVGKTGQVSIGGGTLDSLDLNKTLFFRLYQDISKRTVGMHFTTEEKIGGAAKEWKVWAPKKYKAGTLMGFGIKGFLSQLTEVILPTQRLPIGKYVDQETQAEFLWFRIPYSDETPGKKKFETD